MIQLGAWQLDFNQEPMLVFSILLLISLSGTLWLVGKRLFRSNSLRFFLTAFLNLVAYSAVLVLLLQPVHRQAADETVILLTDGFSDQQTGPLNSSRVYDLRHPMNRNPVIPGTGYRPLADIAQLLLKEPGLARIRVLGSGLSRSQWLDLPGDIFIEYEPQAVTGFTDIRWQKTIIAGQSLAISGGFQSGNRDDIIEIRLLDPSGVSITGIRNTAGQAFDLITQPRARGLLLYTLQAWLGDTLISEEVLPVEVRRGDTLNIQIEQSAPSYETRQLKDFSSLRGHRLFINTRISKARYIKQASGSPTTGDSAFLPQNLARQDVLIMDAASLAELDMQRTALLMDAIDDGLGLLILADSSLPELSKSTLLEGFTFKALPAAEPEAIPRLLADAGTVWQLPLPVAAIEMEPSTENTLIDDGEGRRLVSWRPRGKGHIAVSLLAHTDRWLRHGNRREWGELWSAMLALLARQPEHGQILDTAEFQIPRVDHRAAICALASGQDMKLAIAPLSPGRSTATGIVTPAKDQLGSARACAYFWPVTPGWHRVKLMSTENDTMLDDKTLYVFDAQQWLADELLKRQRDTLARLKANTIDNPDLQHKWLYKPAGVFWPWLILVLSATLLWLERKFFVPRQLNDY